MRKVGSSLPKPVRYLLMSPLWLCQIGTGYRSFRDNPILGSIRLNQLGLHVTRLRLAYWLSMRRRQRLQHLLSPEDKVLIDQHGFLCKRPFLAPDIFDAVRKEIVSLEENAREMLQGDAITRRIPLDASTLSTLPHTRNLLNHPALQGYIRYIASFDMEPVFYVQTILNHIKPRAPLDPQTNLHSDTFHPSAKAWFFLTDVTAADGPFTYVSGSHILTPERIAWEKHRSITIHHSDHLSQRGSLRIEPHELPELALPPAQAFTVPANTLVVGDTFGFHARGLSQHPCMRLEIWAYARRNPFVPFTNWDIWSLRPFKYQKTPLFWRLMDLREKIGGKKNPWRNAGKRFPLSPETIAGTLPPPQ